MFIWIFEETVASIYQYLKLLRFNAFLISGIEFDIKNGEMRQNLRFGSMQVC